MSPRARIQRLIVAAGLPLLAASCERTPPATSTAGPNPPTTVPSATSPSTTLSPDEPVAVYVNGHPILEREVEEAVVRRTPTEVFENPAAVSMLEHYRTRMREALIDRYLLERRAAKEGVTLSDADMARDMEAELKGFLSDNGLTEAQFEQQLRAERGQSVPQFLASRAADEDMRRARLHARLVQRLYPDEVQITDDEIRDYYEKNRERRYTRPERVRASQILIGAADGNEAERAAARAKAEAVLAQARQPGADFAALAREHSTDPSRGLGGDLGFFTRRGQQVDAVADAAFGLEVGQISEVVESPLGFHIIRLTDRQPGHQLELESVRLGIRMILEDQRVKALRKRLVEELRREARIEYPAGHAPQPTTAPAPAPASIPSAP